MINTTYLLNTDYPVHKWGQFYLNNHRNRNKLDSNTAFTIILVYAKKKCNVIIAIF